MKNDLIETIEIAISRLKNSQEYIKEFFPEEDNNLIVRHFASDSTESHIQRIFYIISNWTKGKYKNSDSVMIAIEKQIDSYNFNKRKIQ